MDVSGNQDHARRIGAIHSDTDYDSDFEWILSIPCTPERTQFVNLRIVVVVLFSKCSNIFAFVPHSLSRLRIQITTRRLKVSLDCFWLAVLRTRNLLGFRTISLSQTRRGCRTIWRYTVALLRIDRDLGSGLSTFHDGGEFYFDVDAGCLLPFSLFSLVTYLGVE